MAKKRSEPLIEYVFARLRDWSFSNVFQAGRYLVDRDVANTGSRHSLAIGHDRSGRVLLNRATIENGHPDFVTELGVHFTTFLRLHRVGMEI